jgi:CheY-like chemotaxis protein
MPDTLLLAEDEPLVRGVLSRYLADRGFNVVEAPHGEAALRLLSRNDPGIDVVLTDLEMPGINGYEVVRVLRLYRPDLPVVAMSFVHPDWSEDAGWSGDTALSAAFVGVPLIGKPLDLSLLVRTIEDCVADARERRQEAGVIRERAARARAAAVRTRERARLAKIRTDLVAAALALRIESR